ncbi:putative endonuclease (plasmid) [Nostoc sp. NIES-3756]|uniref:restriction endonuclease n=1 Tax=Nostoc sp. NIES-3756 TaxID=1751286 RepID=UPI000721A6AD|nr:restriction endonuclease [Nostoc sp. NIES-3756]BAT57012.1 putative endonuclease [Nostoc sp. NIES-3756]
MAGTSKSPIQKILFGSPGTGKSYRVNNKILCEDLGIDKKNNPENIIRTVFHPEYTYGDFMGKLVPITKSGKVEYNFYEGHFLKALGQAYKNIQLVKPKSVDQIVWKEVNNVALVIDEINRGNSSAIFGICFQLLDRESDGWSSYEVNLTEIEFYKFIELIGTKISLVDGNLKFQFPGDSHFVFFDSLKDKFQPLGINTETKAIRLPPNLSVLGTMNTSDNSIYFMDSAFKRRWDWEFINWDNSQPPKATYGNLDETKWEILYKSINNFIKKNYTSVRGIEDKQIGKYFIKERPVTPEHIQNKLLFFIWDSVFDRDKKPLVQLLDVAKEDLVTFGDFTKLHNIFYTNLLKNYKPIENNSDSVNENNRSSELIPAPLPINRKI